MIKVYAITLDTTDLDLLWRRVSVECCAFSVPSWAWPPVGRIGGSPCFMGTVRIDCQHSTILTTDRPRSSLKTENNKKKSELYSVEPK